MALIILDILVLIDTRVNKNTTFEQTIQMGTKTVKTLGGVSLDQFKLILNVLTQNNVVFVDYTTKNEIDAREYAKIIIEINQVLNQE